MLKLLVYCFSYAFTDNFKNVLDIHIIVFFNGDLNDII